MNNQQTKIIKILKPKSYQLKAISLNVNAKSYQLKAGFTLFEMLLAVAVIAIVGLIGAPVFQGFKTRNEVDIAAQTVVSALRRASVLSESMKNNSSWGVLATTSQVIVFSGTSYATRNPIYDESFDIMPSLVVSGLTEEVFAKFTGLPSASGTLIITSINNEVRTVSINSKGTVSY
ncbi:MAG: prepilin-type N-terminal cleavage/methylation domain-containing protein [bacterium]|nr:prepilin-type N-terminal cleavage/methylation domain-containing protein [bacterium]